MFVVPMNIAGFLSVPNDDDYDATEEMKRENDLYTADIALGHSLKNNVWRKRENRFKKMKFYFSVAIFLTAVIVIVSILIRIFVVVSD